jgi:hypothetical protein
VSHGMPRACTDCAEGGRTARGPASKLVDIGLQGAGLAGEDATAS